MEIERHSTLAQVTIPAGEALSTGVIDFTSHTMGILSMPAELTALSIGFHVSSRRDGDFLPLYDENGSLVQISSPSINRAYILPPELAGVLFFKLWSQNGSGIDTNQAAGRVIAVVLKA